MPTISLIIAFRDQVHFLPPLLDSLLTQSFQDFEVLLVDDASLKKADDVFSRFSETKLRLTLLRHEERQGLATANRAAFKASGGRYVIFGAADGVFTDDLALQKMVDAAENFELGVLHFASRTIGLESGVSAAESLLTEALGHEDEGLALYDKMWSRNVADRVWPELAHAGLKDDCDLFFNALALPLAQTYAALAGPSVFRLWGKRPGGPSRDLEKALTFWRAAVAAPEFWMANGVESSSIKALEYALRARLSCTAGRICGQTDPNMMEHLLADKSDEELKDIFKMLTVAADCSAVLEGLRREKQQGPAILQNNISGESGLHQAPSPSHDMTVDCSDLKKALADERQKTEAIVGSLSWRLTAPLRAAMRRFKNAPPAGDIISAPVTDESPASLYRALEIERQKVKDLIASRSWRLIDPLRKILGHPAVLVDPAVQAPAKPKAAAAPVKAAKKSAKYQYTVVTACYNIESYLNDYFASLLNQSISFADHIRLIMVDDGSTDGTAAIIKYWQSLYPQNITYVYQENAGQGTASNRGLELVTTPWVTLLDGDDFVDEKYFETIDTFLQKNHHDYDPARQVKLIGCNLIFYIENERAFRNNHALRAKFSKAETILPYNKLGDLIQLSASSSFFSVEELRRQKLFFTEERWPLFEDGSLISQYLTSLKSGLVATLANAKYYYRRRASQNSLNNQSETNKKSYLDVVEDGYLKCLSLSAEKNNGVARSNVQSTVLYDLGWKIILLRNKPLPYFMTAEEGRKCLELMRSCFQYINRRQIEAFPVQYNGFNFSYKVGALACFKNMDPTFQIVYIKEYEKDRRTLLLEYYCREPGGLQIAADDAAQLKILDVKNTPQTILGERFCYMVYATVLIPEGSKYLAINIGETSTIIALHDKHYKEKIEVEAIEKAFAPPSRAASEQYGGAWLLMDRKFQADDNAEHLYRYIAKNYPERPLFYGLLPSSEDWPRLQREGFNMLDPSSDKFKQVLQGCDLIISSHPDECFATAVPNILRYKRLVFLQHGVISQNLSQWLNFKKIDIFITSTRPEYESIVTAQSPYRYSGSRVKLTGLARYDALAPHIGQSEKLLLVMPTWRHSLTPNPSAANGPSDAVLASEYVRAWGGFLKSGRLKELADKYGFRILFYPHINMQAYIDGFKLPDYIQLPSSTPGSIQEVFKNAAIMVSDYSSCVFEMAFLKKSVLHYQFDRGEVLFGNAHTYTQGYFDYYRDGFGPVAETEDVLLDELEKIMARGGEPEPVYLKRMEETFPWRDGNNCERIYQEILKLDQPFEESEA